MAAYAGNVWIDGKEALQNRILVDVIRAMGVNRVVPATIFEAAVAFDDQKGICPGRQQIGGKPNSRLLQFGDRRRAVAKENNRPDGGGKESRGTCPSKRALAGKRNEISAARTGE